MLITNEITHHAALERPLDIRRPLFTNLGIFFPVIAEATGLSHQLFGVKKQFNLQYGTPSRLTAAFLIDKDGALEMVHYGKYHEDFSDIIKP